MTAKGKEEPALTGVPTADEMGPGGLGRVPAPASPQGTRSVVAYGPAAASVRVGEIIADKYRVERVLGVGGMGVVVAAHHIHLDARVALKFLLPETLSNSDAVVRFLREARAAVKIKSEHVARVTDVGTLPSGAPYMVMEYLEGEDLAEWLKQRGALPIEQAVEFVLQACVAVADAHALGIIHRDLKPANLFCVRRSDGQLSIKVLDFGISKMTETGGAVLESVTRTAAVMGSPFYMSPEQMRSSRNVDTRTDIWALGMILFELIARRPAFRAETVTELAIQVANEPTPPIRTFRPDVPEGLEAILFKCLQKDRNARYPNVAELALALLPFAPRRAKASVERISGIVRAAGLSASALDMPPSPEPVAEARNARTQHLPSSSSQPAMPPYDARSSLPAPSPHAPATIASVGRTAAAAGRGKWAAIAIAGGVGITLTIGVVAASANRRAMVGRSFGNAPLAKTRSEARAPSSSAPAEPPPSPGTPAPWPAAAAGSGGSSADSPAATSDASSETHSAPRSGANSAPPGNGSGTTPSLRASTGSTRPPAPVAPPAAHAAAARSCRIVSSFDKDGNEHFRQICK